MLSKKKAKGTKKSLDNRSQVIVGLRSKLPKSKVKLGYLAVLGVFVFTIIGYGGWTGYRYRQHQQFVSHAQWSWPITVGYGTSYQVCKQYKAVYGGVYDIYFYTKKPVSVKLSVYTNVERMNDYGLWTSDPSGPANWSDSWWVGVGNTSIKTVSVWGRQRVKYVLYQHDANSPDGRAVYTNYIDNNLSDQYLPPCNR